MKFCQVICLINTYQQYKNQQNLRISLDTHLLPWAGMTQKESAKHNILSSLGSFANTYDLEGSHLQHPVNYSFVLNCRGGSN